MWYGCHYYYQDLYWKVESLQLQSTILFGPSMVGGKVAGVYNLEGCLQRSDLKPWFYLSSTILPFQLQQLSSGTCY